ncbi:hypothetical protein C8T65DRAFT_61647 [Cerioporus squamosus]|nr:hypothetical protein C8T65DRAFT_61647 [Cerioporus squamosus]
MAESASSGSSHTRTIVIATVASIGGVLLLVIVVALIIYCGRRRNRSYTPPADGVLARDAAPIDEDDPGTSGWVEGTWTGDDESTVGRRSNSGKRKRGASNAQGPVPPVPSKPVLPVLPKTKSPGVPQSTISGVPAFRILSPSQMSRARADPVPLSPTSSFGNLTSPMPDSATYLITPAESAAYPGPARYTSTNTNTNTNDTFLDMGRSFTDADASLTTLSSHNAHPFATAQAVMPSSYAPARQRSGRDRSDSNQSTSSQATVSAALPTAPPSALSAATRGPARGPAKKPSNSDLVSPSASTVTFTAPSSYGNPAGSSTSAGRIVRSPSPSTLPSSSAATTPTSTTTLMPKRQASNAGATSRGPAPPRRVDPVDPAMQPPRDPDAYKREKERERERRHERERDRDRERERQRGQVQGPRQAQTHPQPQPQPQARGQERAQPQEHEQEQQAQGQAQNKEGRRQGMMMSDRDRKRFGFLDVPQDAADSRPPSYRETG